MHDRPLLVMGNADIVDEDRADINPGQHNISQFPAAVLEEMGELGVRDC